MAGRVAANPLVFLQESALIGSKGWKASGRTHVPEQASGFVIPTFTKNVKVGQPPLFAGIAL
jgi:hypothetical protein